MEEKEKQERIFHKAKPAHVEAERERLLGYNIYLERYVAKTFNKLKKQTFAIGLFSAEGILVDLYPRDDKTLEELFGGDIQVGDIWQDVGYNGVSQGLSIRRSCSSVGEENENPVLKKYAIYFSIMNMRGIYEPYDLEPACGVAILTPVKNAWDVYYAMIVGIAHDLMLNVQFKNTSVKFYERSGKGLLVVDAMMADKTVVTYYNEELLRILGVPKINLWYRPVEELINPLPDNREFWSIIEACRVVSNYPLKIRVGEMETECLVSTDAYKQPSIKSVGVIFYMTTQQKISAEVSEKMANGAVKSFDDIIGEDMELKKIIERAKRMALTDSNIMILGESGTGKDVMAQAIHNASHRRKKPFIALNCGAVPKDLIESELFGYEAGAFTGAKKNGNMGKFELASGGTIFLDEIGEMPLDLQAKLLRVVEQKQLMRLGGSRLINVDVKIIAATNVDIWDMIQKKQFRADLFYRLSTMRLNLMPLRERKGGILVPHIRTGEECRRAQEALRYPPKGNASCCRSNHADGFEAKNWMKYLDHVQDLCFVPMIEDPEAIDNLDEILDELDPERDMVMFGKADYGQALGSLNPDGTFTSAVNEGYLKVLERCRERHVGFMACPSAGPDGQTAADVAKVIEEGCSAVVLNTDQLTLAAAFHSIVGKCLDLKIKE